MSCICACHDRYLQGVAVHYSRNCGCKEEDRMPESESTFSTPVEYTDTDGEVKIIPQGFKEVLDHIDSLPRNEDTINQIETFMVKLKEAVAWNEDRKTISHLPVCDECDGLSNGPWTPGACPKCLGLGRANGTST